MFLGGQAISLIGDGLALVAVPLLVLQFTRDPLLAALAVATRSAGYLLVGLPAGPIVDRLAAWQVLTAADAVRAVAFAALGVVAWLRVPSVGLILAISFTSACASVFFDAALAVTVRDLFPGDQVLPANSALETASQLARVIGPAGAGLIAETAGLQAALWIDAATFVVSLSTVSAVFGIARAASQPAVTLRRAGRRLRGDLADGLRYLRSQQLIMTFTLLFAVTNLCLGADTLLVYFGRVSLGLTPFSVSAVVAAGGGAGVAGALTARRMGARYARLPLIAVTILVAGGAVTGMSAARSWWSLAAANAVLIFASSQGGLLFRSLRQELVPREMLGRVTAAVRTLFVAATPLGGLLAGLGTQAAGGDPRPVFLAAGVVLTASIAVAWMTVLRRPATASGQTGRFPPAAAVTATGGSDPTRR